MATEQRPRCEVVYPGYEARCLREADHAEPHLAVPKLTGRRGFIEWEGLFEGARLNMAWEWDELLGEEDRQALEKGLQLPLREAKTGSPLAALPLAQE